MFFQYSTPINDNTRGRSHTPLLTVSGSGGFRYSSDLLPVDSVTLTGGSYPLGGFQNDTVIRGGFARPGDPANLANGQSIEDVFNNPFTADTMHLKESLDQIAAARALFGSPSTGGKPGAEAQKGDLRVIAGDRADGVKPKEVRIDDANNYDWQKYENSYQDNRQEARFKDGEIGREYDVTVTWADGTTTRKRVTLKEPGQIVYMNDSYSY